MVRHAIRTLCACAFVFAASTTANADDTCKLVRVASYDFTAAYGMIVIPVSIGGRTVSMAVDTGAVVSDLDPGLANTMHLPNYEVPEGSMFNSLGEPYTQGVTAHQVAIGTLNSAAIDTLVSPSPVSQDGSIQGHLGNDLLRQFDVDIDFGAKKLNLFSKDHCDGQVVYWQTDSVSVIPMHVVRTGQVMVPMVLDGHPFTAMLDTGSPNTHLSLEAAHDIFGLTPDSPAMTKVGVFGPGGRTPVYQHVFDALSLQGIAFGHPAIRVREDAQRVSIKQSEQLGSRLSHVDENNNAADLVLGNNELRKLHVYIAYKEQKLYVSAATPPKPVASGGATAPSPAATP